MPLTLADRSLHFGTCITRLSSIRCREAGAINLAQGFPEQDPPAEVLEAHIKALRDGHNQYADMRGLPQLREAVARYYACLYSGACYDPEEEILIGCGATEMAIATLLALVNPGEEVLVQAPSYENFPAQVRLCDGTPVFFCLDPNSRRLRREALEAAASSRTRGVILNTPNNPSGRCFSAEEIGLVADFCRDRDLFLLLDTVYERIVFGEHDLASLWSFPGMKERTILVSSLSKTWAATGWRVGWALAAAPIMAAVRRCHDFLTGCAPTAAQFAAVAALELPESFYKRQREEYAQRRDVLAGALREAGFEFSLPDGAYYILADGSRIGYPDSSELAVELLHRARVGVVPWQAFFPDGEQDDRRWFRINFAKSRPVIEEAARRILAFARDLPAQRE